MPAGAVQGNIKRRTSEDCVVDVGKLPGIDAQLRAPDNGIHAHVHKRRQRNRPGDGEPVFQIRDQAGIAARKHDALDRHRYGVVAAQRVAGILGDDGAIGVLQSDRALVRKKRYRRDGTDIKAANVIFAAQIEALKRRRNHSAIARQERTLTLNPIVFRRFCIGMKCLY